jgi:plastocyanin
MRRVLSATGAVVLMSFALLHVAQSQQPGAPATDRVGFPTDYRNRFQVLYVLDRPDNKQVRTIYANDLAASVKFDIEHKFPYGSVLVMETWASLKDSQTNPILDANGRYQKDPNAVPTLFVMRKEQGYGTAYGPNRTGEWEYVAYRPDGTYQTTPQNSFGCAACHNQSNATKDWTFRTSQDYTGNSGAVPDPTIVNYKFVPGAIRVKAGSFMTFHNQDVVEHNVIDDFASPNDPGVRLKAGTTATYKFDTAGEFNFHCSIHPAMRGKVVVE